MPALAVVAGFALGTGGLEFLDLDPRSWLVGALAAGALVVILFRDGLEVEAELLQREWHVPVRALAIAMPLTAGMVALLATLVTDLSWDEALLLGALLSPTDPVLSSSVVTNPRVPRLIRHSLNLESGLNDGLALTAVLAFAAALDPSDDDFVWWRFVLQDVGLGLVVGVGVAVVAARLMPRRAQVVAALGVAAGTYGLATLVHGNGFIAVFAAAIALGILRPDVLAAFERRSDALVGAVIVGIFLVFGSLLSLSGLFADGWASVAIAAGTLLVVRQVAIFASLAGTGVGTRTKAFIAWFGPKGVATMAFALVVLGREIEAGERLFNIAALTVLASIAVHGLTDRAGAEWIARQGERDATGSGGGTSSPSPPRRWE
jgi:sodium/hydrogen antiporter